MHRLVTLAVGCAVALAAVPPAAAQSWTGIISSDWNTALNWSPATIPNGTGVAVGFSTLSVSSPSYSANISGSVQTQFLTFSNTSGAYNLTSSAGQTLSGLTNITVVNGVTTADTINLSNNSAGSLLFTGTLAIGNNAAASTTPTLVIGPNTVIGTAGTSGISVSGTGTTLISGTFATGGDAVIGGLSMSGPGVLQLSANNANLAGAINVTGGAISIAADTALGPVTNGVTLNGGTLRLTGTGMFAELGPGRVITIGSSGGTFDTSSIGPMVGNVITIASAIVGNGPVTLNAHGDTSNSGNGSNSLLMLNGPNTFLGTVTIGSGVVDAASTFGVATNAISIAGGGLVAVNTELLARNITLAGTGDRIFRVYGGQTFTLADAISGTASLRKTDGGTLVLSAAATYGGSTTIGGGGIQSGVANALPTGTDLTVNAGTTLIQNGFPQTVGSLAGGGAVQLGSGGGSLTAGGDGASTSFTGTINGTGPFTKAGGGTLTLGAANTYTGATTINGGSLQLGVTNTLPVGTDVTLANTAGAALNLNGNTQTLASLAGGGSAGGNVALGSGTLTAGGDNTSTTFGGAFSGTGTFNKAGTGTLTLNGTGSSVGIFNVNAGSVAVNGGSLTVSSSSFSTNVSGGATLTVSGGAVVSGPAGSVVVNGPTGTAATVTGAGSQLTTISFFVGFGGIGSLTVTNGAKAFGSNAIELGTIGGDVGTLVVQGGGSFAASTQYYGIYSGASGTTSVTGVGSTLAAGVLIMGSDGVNPGGVGQLTVANGASATVAGATVLGTSASSITVNGGTFSTGGLAAVAGALPPIILSDPAAGGFAMTIGADNSSSTWPALIADASGGPGTVNKVGTGTLTLTGHLTNTGGYVATAGKIEFNGALLQPGSGTLAAAAGATIQYDGGARVFGGFLAGPGTHVVNGATLTGATSSASAVINVTGPATIVNFSNGGPLTVSAPAASPATFTRFTNAGSGSITIGTNSQANVSDFQTYGVLTLNTGTTASPTQLTNTGTSPLYFNGGSRTFIGTPATAGTIVAGIDLHGQNAIVAGGLFVNNGYVIDSTNSSAVVVADYGALVKGAGFYLNSPVTQNGGRVQAGNSPGSASFGQLTFGPGGVSSYVFAIDDATGTAGPSPDAAGQVSGWGLMKSVRRLVGTATTNGDFTWTADASNKLDFAIETLVNPTTVGTDVSGLMADFDPSRSYSWPAIQWAGNYSGPTNVAALDASTIFDTSGFENPIAGTFGWSFDPVGQTLSLTYTPSAVPEPGTLALVGLAAAGLTWRRRRNVPALPSRLTRLGN